MGSNFCSDCVRFIAICAALVSPAACRAQSAEEAFQKASSALVSQDYQSAEAGFLYVLKKEPNNIGALGNLGVVYSRTHRYPQAIDAYKRALRIAPGDKAMAANLGLAYLKQDQFTAALPIFRNLAADSANLQARELLATCLLSLAQYDAALEVLEPLREAEPKNPGALYMLGIALTRLKRTDDAHAAFTQMMELVSPAQANFLMGKASYETGNFEDAANFFRRAIAADPAIDGGHRELGKTLISLRDNATAEKELKQASPGDPEALYFLGALLAQTRAPEAVALLNQARDLNPDWWGPFYYLGRIEIDRGRAARAIPLLEQAAKLNPEESAIQYQLARALQKTGRQNEAKEAFARVKQLKSTSLHKELDILSPNAGEREDGSKNAPAPPIE